MKPSLQLKLSQHLTLTPQLQQSIKLLQLSTLELNQEIERFLLDNPMLERDEQDDFVAQPGLATSASPAEREREQAQERATSDEDEVRQGSERDEEGIDWSNVGTGASAKRDDDDDVDFQEFQAAELSLREHLDQQVALSPLNDRDRALVRFIIEAIDDDGYLYQPLEELLELLPPEFAMRRLVANNA